jgi:uncharacterized protein (TIGR00290 family)
MKAFVSWSGGKESCLALWRGRNIPGIEVTHLVTMCMEDGVTSRSHELPAALIKAQADSLGLSLIHHDTTWDNYEATFKQVVAGLKDEGVEAGIFGDIDVQPHRDWVERVCADAGITPYLPLWQIGREELMEDFISSGFRAVIVVVDHKYMGNEWLGRHLDHIFRQDLQARAPHVDLCGENGEYHTFVYGGPIFRRVVPFAPMQQEQRDGYGFLRLIAP